jgi:hypothetical protein
MEDITLGGEEDRKEVIKCLEEEVGLAEEEDGAEAGEEVGVAGAWDGGAMELLTFIPMVLTLMEHHMELTAHLMLIPTTREISRKGGDRDVAVVLWIWASLALWLCPLWGIRLLSLGTDA